MQKIKLTYTTRAGIEFTFEFRSKMEVCDRCEGRGTHVNPNIDGNGITSSEWAEWDEESRENYMSGVYDVRCEECNGANVVAVVDEDALTPKQRRRFEACQRQESERLQAEADDRRTRWYEDGCPRD